MLISQKRFVREKPHLQELHGLFFDGYVLHDQNSASNKVNYIFLVDDILDRYTKWYSYYAKCTEFWQKKTFLI